MNAGLLSTIPQGHEALFDRVESPLRFAGLHSDAAHDAEPLGLDEDLAFLGPILGSNTADSVPVEDYWHPDHRTTTAIRRIGAYWGHPVSGDGTVIARQDGWDVAMAKQVGAGRVFVWNDEWITFDSEWVSRTDY